MVARKKRKPPPEPETRGRKPHFFKILLGDFRRRLRIPPMFLKHISDESSDGVTLCDPGGNRWPVSLDTTIDGTFLSSGWPSFVRDCALKEHELLVFCYDGRMQFTVLSFDETACQKKEVIPTTTENDSKLCEAAGEQEKSMNDSDLRLPLRKFKSRFNELLSKGKHKTSSKIRDRMEIKSEGLVMNKAEGDVATSSAPGLKKYTKRHKLDAEKAANSFCSEFPYFVRRMIVCNVSKSYTLRIPAAFSRAHLPEKKTKMVLQDPTGRAWTVVCIPGSTSLISGGWTAFVRGNNLKAGDFCAFEMVGPVELRVTIFRAKGTIKLCKK